MRLIDADKLMEVIDVNDYLVAGKHNDIGMGMFTDGIRQAIDEQPTVSNCPVVEGTRGYSHPAQTVRLQRCAIISTDDGWVQYEGVIAENGSHHTYIMQRIGAIGSQEIVTIDDGINMFGRSNIQEFINYISDKDNYGVECVMKVLDEENTWVPMNGEYLNE